MNEDMSHHADPEEFGPRARQDCTISENKITAHNAPINTRIQ